MTMVNYPREAKDLTATLFLVGVDEDDAIERARREFYFGDIDTAKVDYWLYGYAKGVVPTIFEVEVPVNISTNMLRQAEL